MQIKSARFVMSNSNMEFLPKPTLPEYAFIGRSNVGKSSLINSLCNNKKLAKTSGRPGKTQLINHFIINDTWYLVDLPGYGFAKTTKQAKSKWQNFTRNYLRNRENLLCVFLLIDSRHPPQKVDTDFMEWMAINQIPFVIVFTKIDKLSSAELQKNSKNYANELLKTWEFLPQIFKTSAESKVGNESLLNFIEETNKAFQS